MSTPETFASWLPLRRIEGGVSSIYETRDGKWQIVKDPTSGDEHGGWGYTSWLIYLTAEDGPFIEDRFETLRQARGWLAREMAARGEL